MAACSPSVAGRGPLALADAAGWRGRSSAWQESSGHAGHAEGLRAQGYYEDGRFGIRIENLLVCKEVATPYRFGGLASLGFDRLTLCPLQRKMLAPEVGPSAYGCTWLPVAALLLMLCPLMCTVLVP